ncbi:hypothetical protein RvY_10823 [Ramazzottius varieornatus]|uniref:Uncharacterized protein n=1 Tax=Ramazzottius varieornatus TaxID=947166 RepID=A0A1D1VE20_RAMVA|nr:hypothetical protein RvY_10823 [Ramazzottius varieornatus]
MPIWSVPIPCPVSTVGFRTINPHGSYPAPEFCSNYSSDYVVEEARVDKLSNASTLVKSGKGS